MTPKTLERMVTLKQFVSGGTGLLVLMKETFNKKKKCFVFLLLSNNGKKEEDYNFLTRCLF